MDATRRVLARGESDRALQNEGASTRAPHACRATAEVAKTRDENRRETAGYGRTALSCVQESPAPASRVPLRERNALPPQEGRRSATRGAGLRALRVRKGKGPGPLAERFFRYVTIDDVDKCWPWTGGRDGSPGGGYGVFFVGGRARQIRAHIFAYRMVIGPVPPGLVLDHVVCDNKGCVNPYHLEPKPRRANTLRGTSPAARNARKSHCDRGHEFNAQNASLYAKSKSIAWRRCLVCHREDMRARRAGGQLAPCGVYSNVRRRERDASRATLTAIPNVLRVRRQRCAQSTWHLTIRALGFVSEAEMARGLSDVAGVSVASIREFPAQLKADRLFRAVVVIRDEVSKASPSKGELELPGAGGLLPRSAEVEV